jgi:ABC-type dipeptide/oligopeptide/nickel transport system permease subunit
MDRKIILNRMCHSPFFVIGTIVLVFVIAVVMFMPFFIDWDPTKQSLAEKLVPPEGFSKGFRGHILGTDQLGRDLLARLLLGGRISLVIACAVVVLQNFIGVVCGIAAGYFGGKLDTFIMRVCDVLLAIPLLVLAIAVIAVIGANIGNLILVMSVTNWVFVCKVIRNDVRIYRNKEFVKASIAFGAGKSHVMFKQIFPNVTTNLIILASQNFGGCLLIEASLSFLNLGVLAPDPSWGNMINVGRNYLVTQPWLAIAPGIALMLIVLALNFLGDGLRDVLDPKENRSKLGRRRVRKQKWAA